MSVINRLAYSLNRKDELPNLELALEISKGNDQQAVQELIGILQGKNKNLQNDAMKVIYETGRLKPDMLVDHTDELIALLNSKNNRLQWGAMMALAAITTEIPDMIFQALPRITGAADNGSVITNDHCVVILVKFCQVNQFRSEAFQLLLDRLIKSPVNQLPMYAEISLPVIIPENKAIFISTLQRRLPEIEKEPKRKRIEKVIKRLQVKDQL